MKIGDKGLMYDVFISVCYDYDTLLAYLRKSGIQFTDAIEGKIRAQPFRRKTLYEVVLFDGHSLSSARLSYGRLTFEASRMLMEKISLEAACLLFASLTPKFMESFGFEAVVACQEPIISEWGEELLVLLYEQGVFTLQTISLPDCSSRSKRTWAFAFQRI